MAGRFSIQGVFTGSDRFSGMLGRIERSVGRFSGGVGAQLKRIDAVSTRAFGGMKTVAVVGTAAAVGLGTALASVVTAGADLEHTLVGAAAKFSPEYRRGTEQFNMLRTAAERVGSSTEFGAQQAAAALKDLGAAGFNLEQALALLPSLADLGTAAELDLSAASTIATKSLGAFNLKVDDSIQLQKNFSRINDVMARTADATTASMEGLFETIQEAGPVATGAGVSLETFHAIAGQLSQNAIDASVAGTTMKNMFLTLAAPTTEAAAALTKLGIKTKDSSGNLRDVLDVLGELQGATAKMGTATRAGTLEQIFGKIPIAGVNALLSGGIDKVRALRTELEHAGGSMSRMADIMRDDLKGDIGRAGQALDAMRIGLFGVVSGPLTPLVQGVTAWALANKDVVASGLTSFLKDARDFGRGFVKVFGGAVAPIKDAAVWLGRFVSAGKDADSAFRLGEGAARLAVGLGAAALALKAVTLATTAWSGVMALNPTGALIIGLAALLGLYVAYKPQVDAFIGRHRTAFKVLGVGVGIIAGAVIAMKAWELGIALNAAAWAGWTLVSNSATAAMVASKVAAVAANASLLPLIATLGAAAAAVGALVMVYQQWQQLEQAAGGTEGIKAGLGSFFEGNGFFAGVDEHMNEQARRAAPAGSVPGTTPIPPLTGQDNLSAFLRTLEQPAGAPVPGVAPVSQGAQAAGEQQAQVAALIAALEKSQGQKVQIDLKLPPGVGADVKTPQGPGKVPVKVPKTGAFTP